MILAAVAFLIEKLVVSLSSHTQQLSVLASVNCYAGTMEMKPIDSITKDVIMNFMIEKVLPSVCAKWPREDANKPIFIQQDNAQPQVAIKDKIFCDAAKQDGFDIRLITQP
mgnify:CR=1 FL=1